MSRCLLLSIASLAVCVTSEVALAGILDSFFGSGPVLEQRVRQGSDGLVLRETFRIRKSCSYDFEILFLHDRYGELDPLFRNETFPVPIAIRVFRDGNPSAAAVLQGQQAPKIYGHGAQTTSFIVGSARLDKGNYRVEMNWPVVPALADRDIDFVVQVRPKTRCS